MHRQGQSEQQWQQSQRQAQSCLQQQDYPGAIEAARESLQLKPDQARSLGILAGGLKEQGDYLTALQCIDQAHSLEPDQGIYRRIKAEICLKQGDLNSAQQLTEEILDHTPADHAAREFLGDVLRIKKQFENALIAYQDLPESAALKSKIFDCLTHVRIFRSHPLFKAKMGTAVEILLMDYLNDDRYNSGHLSRLTCDLLARKHLSQDHIDLNVLAADPLLSLSLTKFVFHQRSLEPLLLNLRAGLLQTCLEQLSIADDLETLGCALAIQCFSNEYCWYINEEEQTLLDGLEVLYCQTVEAGMDHPDEISAIVLLLALYKPVFRLPYHEQLAAMPLMDWPEAMRQLIQIGLLDILEEREIALGMDSIDKANQTRQVQTEEQPYPRWLTLNRTDQVTPYVDLYEYLEIQPEDFFPAETLQILVAGCGTGQRSNILAEQTKDARITAIDLSGASLACGKRMAQRYKLNNVEYLQGDILQLHSLQKRFHVIECSGVLHHLQDPMEGLAALVGLLKPGGLLNISLYSTRAREPVIRFRNINNRIGVQPTDENIRLIRQQLICGEVESEVEPILSWQDFYSMSSCRDLLFPVREHQFTLLRIKEMLAHHSLVFKGFKLDSRETLTQYRALFPDAIDLLNLDYWHQLEQQYPATFENMYQFHCRLGD